MSIYDYLGSQRVVASIDNLTAGNEFYTLIMAAFRFADSDNVYKLQMTFPELWAEYHKRYNAPGGALDAVELRSVYGVPEEHP